MKPQELKLQYVQLRAEGKSYDQIAKELNISKSTCTEWERALAAQIDEVKRAKLNELIEAYGMTKEARIRNLGDTLEKIDKALQAADFSQVDIDKLLTLKLKYAEQLKAESLPLTAAKHTEIKDAKDILAAYSDLLNRVRAGEVTTEQAQKEGLLLAQLLKAYDEVEIKAKLDKLEAIVGGQQ